MKIKEDILKILDKCTIEGDTVFLPNEQLDRKTYTDVNKCLESIGGKWNKKAKGHVFDEDPTELFDNLILTGETVDLKKEYQYFPTPSDIAKSLVEMAEIKDNDIILEPSAGQGVIADLIPKENIKLVIELNSNNAKILENKGYQVICTDFLTYNNYKFDKVIMNPPFSRQQDVDHILHAFSLLKEGGILVAIVSESPFFRENKKSVEFRKWLTDNNAIVLPLLEGAFKESGTMVKTRIIKVIK